MLESNDIRVLIVEDAEEVRQSLSDLFSTSNGFQLAGSFSSAEEFLKRLATRSADVCLVDIQLPGMNGIELIRRLKKRAPKIQSMMLTIFDDDQRVFESVQAGALGYLLKTTPDETILRSVRELHNGGSPMSSRVARRILDSLKPQQNDELAKAKLTSRELEILRKLSEGLRYQDIGNELSISLSTVRTHCHNVYEKLHVRTRAEALKKALPQ